MPFENVRGLHADRFLNSPGTLACIRSGQANLLLFAISEGAETPHASIHPFLTRLSVDSFPMLFHRAGIAAGAASGLALLQKGETSPLFPSL